MRRSTVGIPAPEAAVDDRAAPPEPGRAGPGHPGPGAGRRLASGGKLPLDQYDLTVELGGALLAGDRVRDALVCDAIA